MNDSRETWLSMVIVWLRRRPRFPSWVVWLWRRSGLSQIIGRFDWHNKVH